MEADWPADCRFPQLARRRRCRCESKGSKASSRWRSRPSRHCPRSWVAVPAQGVVQGGVGMGGGAGVGSVGYGLGMCSRPASADPGPRPHVSRRPSTAPAPGTHLGPTRTGSVSSGRHRPMVSGAAAVVPVPPVLPEEQLDSWTLDESPLKGAIEGPNVCAGARGARGRAWHGEDGGRGAAPVDDDALDSLREARVPDSAWSRPPMPPAVLPRTAACRPPAMDDGSVRSSVVTAASAACSSIATSSSTPMTSRTNSGTGTVTATSGTVPTTTGSQATSASSHTASLDHPHHHHTAVPEAIPEFIDDVDPLDLDPLAVKTFHDDSQGSDMVLPVRAEAGTDPVAELDEGLQGLQGERARKRRRDRDARRRLPARYRVPLYEYHPTLQALQGRRSRSEGGALDAEGGRTGTRQPRVAAETRRRRMDRLSQPNYRHDSRMRKAEVRPNLSVGPDPIWPISKAALRALPTSRVSVLSMAPPRRSELKANISRSRAAHATGSVTSRVSARLEALSKPRLQRVLVPGERACPAGSQRRFMTDAEWRHHKEWLRVNAQPRRDHSLDQRGARRGRTASLRRLLPRLRALAKPSHRSVVKPSETQLKTVSQGALRYQASERIIQLSQPLQRRVSVSR